MNAIKLIALPLLPMTLAAVTIAALRVNKHGLFKKQKLLTHETSESKNYGSANINDVNPIYSSDHSVVDISSAFTTNWISPKSTDEDNK